MNTELLDREDLLAEVRDQFYLPAGQVYLDGNSLGPLPLAARDRVADLTSRQWGEDLITSWNRHGWIDLPQRCGEKIAPLLGASQGQVVCCDSISVNLFKVLTAALRLNSGRKLVLSQKDNFPTDLYMAQGLEQLLGAERCELKTVTATELENCLDSSVAVLMLTHVNFRSGEVHDMVRLTELAHKNGILVIWDLAHSAGALPLELDRCGVDFAVGCGYKFLNGGPGAPAFVYVAQRWQDAAVNVLSGWMGHAQAFAFAPDYVPAAGINRFLSGTPPILAMAALDAALDVFAQVDMQQVRNKSLALSDLLIERLDNDPALTELRLISPRQHHLRGSQVALAHPDAYALTQCLIAHGFVADFRAPDILRVGITPLYTRFADIEAFAKRLAVILSGGEYRQPRFAERQRVT